MCLSAAGVPEFFIDQIQIECAGPGLVRIFGIAHRGGDCEVLYTVVMLADSLARAANELAGAARDSLATTQKRPDNSLAH
jgi:hypothetical protein